MPDFERLNRSLEEHFSDTPENDAFLAGKYAGMDYARWQVVVIVFIAAVLFVIFTGS